MRLRAAPGTRRAHSRPARVVRLLAALLAVLVGAVTLATPAAAHDEMLGSDPADGASLDAAPEELRMSFSGQPLEVGSVVVVTGPDGTDWADGAPTVEGGDLVQPLRDGMPAGDYGVEWRAVSGDGHAVTGELTFTLTETAVADDEPTTPTAEPTAEPAAAEPSATPTPTQTTDADAEDAAGAGGGLPWWAYVLLAVAGVVVGLVIVRRNRA